MFAGLKGTVIQKSVNIAWPLFFFYQAHRNALLKLLVILGVLLVAPLVGVVITRINAFIIIALTVIPIAVFALNYLLKRPYLQPVAILFVAAFIPFTLSTGTESKLVDSLLLTMLFFGVWVGNMLIFEKRLTIQPSPVNMPLFGFAIITIIALIWSMFFRDPLINVGSSVPLVQTASAVVMIMLPGAMLLVPHVIDDEKWFKVMVGIILLAGVLGLFRRLGGLPLVFVNDSGLFTMWVVCLSVALLLFNKNISMLLRIALSVLALGWIYYRFGQQVSWLAGWLPVLVSLIILTFMRSKKLFFGLIIIGAIVISFNAREYLASVVEAESDESGHTRMAAWEVNWRVTGKHLLFGTGPGGYATYYMTYYPTEGMATHNNYIDIIAQTGIFGLIFVVWFFSAMVWVGYKVSQRLRGRGDFVEALANGALAGTIGCVVMMAFGDWLFPFAYTQTIAGFDYIVYSWLFMGAILALDKMYPAQAEILK